jgi:predicted nucleic acid-binding protein
MEIVSNSSPIIHLAKIGKLDLLNILFHTIKIPGAVYRECVIEGGGRAEVNIIRDAEWIKVINVDETHLTKLLKSQLDKGESEVIALALDIGSDLVLLDDYEAREKARLLGLKVTGTIGILLKAKKKGLIRDLKDEIKNLQLTGFWLKKDFIKNILKIVGEI